MKNQIKQELKFNVSSKAELHIDIQKQIVLPKKVELKMIDFFKKTSIPRMLNS